MSQVGKAVPHESADGHVTGSALYTDDLIGRFPAILHGWPVVSRILTLRLSPSTVRLRCRCQEWLPS